MSAERLRTVILAGGFGTRLTDGSDVKPKPMIEIGGRPILWHIMKHYSRFGFGEFVVALGYKGDVIKRYFLDYPNLNGSMCVDLASGQVDMREQAPEDWMVHLWETGADTQTGGRVKRLERLLKGETFMLTYGDGLSDVDINALLAFHRSHGRIATITAVRPPARFGGLIFEGDLVSEFTEKPQIGEGWINGGFLVFESAVFDYLKGDETSLEADALEDLSADRQLAAFKHDGFWQCMDTPRDKRILESLWEEGSLPGQK